MTESIASISATAGVATASGDILRLQGKYVAVRAGEALGGSVGSSQAAAERLIHAFAELLPKRAERWQVTLECSSEGASVAFSRPALGVEAEDSIHVSRKLSRIKPLTRSRKPSD